MNDKLLALLRNIMNELDELRQDVNGLEGWSDAVEYNIERHILLQALIAESTKDGE